MNILGNLSLARSVRSGTIGAMENASAVALMAVSVVQPMTSAHTARGRKFRQVQKNRTTQWKGVVNDNDNDADIFCGVDSSIDCARHH